MKRVLLAVLMLLTPTLAFGQARIVAACGALAPFGSQPAGNQAYETMDVNGNLCTNAVGGTSGGGGIVQQGAKDATAVPWAFDTTGTGNLDTEVKSPVSLPINITEHDCSVTLTTGGTAQQAFAASATIHGFRIANTDTGHNDEVAWFSTTTTTPVAAGAGVYPLPPPTATTYAGFGSYTTPAGEGVNTALTVVAATTGHIIACTYW